MGLLFVFLISIASLLPISVEAPYVYFAPITPLQQRKEANILFAGDMMFDRSIRIATEKEGDGFVLSCVKDVLRQADLVVANLEGPITSHPSMSATSVLGTPENITFTFPTTTAELLARHNMGLVNIGNNHIMNFGSEGLAQTKEWLSKAGVNFFGDPETDNVAKVTVGGIPFSFVSWSDWTGGTQEKILDKIRAEAAQGQIVVVYTHWGEEYVEPPASVRELAHAFVEAGAEIIIGSHPHVIQESELYNGKQIYYSLGNFVFDQYWDEEVRTGLLLQIAFNEGGVESIDEIKTRLERDRRTCLKEQEIE
ncbi:CapA family protein [Candidatus Kaiserbacteria bacterium]|nr:CapA family protein [Candidatus Kaiserbacteria bacterium]